ncbi:hypothetical protein TIFTF001_012648 [Ficus carica]|uniref:GED domain-containing protein n=1 Tax=Ficus carica TaxID=3494 RepID=A0AA88D5C9_FICCA|nr:hypothetical protein TIFTF001_012648 [Ficus carica]
MNLGELNKLPKNMFTIAEAMTAFMRILGFVKESLRKVRLTGEFDEYPNEKCMHCTARLVNGIASIPIAFVERLWHYIGEVVIAVLMSHVEDYYQLQLSTRRASHNLIAKMKERSVKWMMGVVEMEKLTDYTCNPEFLSEWNRLIVFNLVNNDLEAEIVTELMTPHSGGIERLMEESPSVTAKRLKLNGSVKKLQECKKVLANIMDSVASYGD